MSVVNYEIPNSAKDKSRQAVQRPHQGLHIDRFGHRASSFLLSAPTDEPQHPLQAPVRWSNPNRQIAKPLFQETSYLQTPSGGHAQSLCSKEIIFRFFSGRYVYCQAVWCRIYFFLILDPISPAKPVAKGINFRLSPILDRHIVHKYPK